MFSMVFYDEMIFEYVTDVFNNALSHEFAYSIFFVFITDGSPSLFLSLS